MRPDGSRALVAIAIAALTLTAALGSGAVAQESSTDTVCSLLTVDEVAAAIGTEVTAEGTTDEWVSTCTWTASDAESYAYLYAEWAAGSADQIRTDLPYLTETTVAGHPAFSDGYQLMISLDEGVLRLDAASEDGDDPTLLTNLGELAVSRSGSLPTPALLEEAVGPAVGENPVGDAFCDLLTSDEVGLIVGTTFDAVPDATGCTWSATGGAFSTMSAQWTETTLTDHKAAWPDGEDISVGGKVAYYSPGLFLNELLIEADAGVLYLVITGYDGDVKAALANLGELVVSRAGSLPPPPTPEPPIDAHADATLESMLPESVGGEPLSLSSVSADAIGSQLDPDVSEQLEGILAAQGRSLGDVSLVFAGTLSGSSILGIRIAGGDASAVGPLLVGSMAGAETPELTPGQVAGKDVQIVTLGTDTAYYYVTGDTAWFVDAEEPALTEIFEALP